MKHLLTCILFFVFSTGLSQTQAQIIEWVNGEVIFESRTQIERFEGRTTSINGYINLDEATFKFEVSLDSVSTGNRRRDRNMYERYLKTDSYPFATFNGQLEFDENDELQSVTGDFEISGKTNRLTMSEVSLIKIDEGYSLSAEFEISLEQFEIPRPRFLLVTMNDTQHVRIVGQMR